jgi:hypothetical protein
MTRVHGCAALALAAVIAGCVEREPKGDQPPPPDPAFIEKNILAEAPTLPNPVNADLGGKVVYLGNDVAKGKSVRPGDKIKIVHYWRVAEPPGGEWRVFTHVVGAKPADWMNVDYTPMRTGHGPDKWKTGQIIRDEQEIVLKSDWSSPFAQVAVGLYRKGNQENNGRLPIVSGPADKESRVLAARLTVVGKGKAAPAGVYVIKHTSAPMVIDGKADEPAWAEAAYSPDFTDTEGGTSIGQKTRAKLVWDNKFLYAFIEASDTDVFSEFVKRDDTLWKADVVELFIDADGNRKGYVELQVNPNNAQLDAWFPQTRAQSSDFDWSADMVSAVNVRGTTAIRNDTDEGWDVEIAIPLAAVKGKDDKMNVVIPPAVGDTWKLNVVRVDKPRDAKQIRASSWSQITIQDFHALDRMSTVRFGDASGGLEPKLPAIPLPMP